MGDLFFKKYKDTKTHMAETTSDAAAAAAAAASSKASDAAAASAASAAAASAASSGFDAIKGALPGIIEAIKDFTPIIIGIVTKLGYLGAFGAAIFFGYKTALTY